MKLRLLLSILILSSACTYGQTRKKPAVKKPAAKAVNAQDTRAKALFDEMLPNTQRLFIIDSIVVDQSQVLASIPLPKDYGAIVPYNQFFENRPKEDTYVFVNGFGNRCYYALNDTTGTSRFFSCEKVGGEWSQPKEFKSLGEGLTHINYPFMGADGTSLYFAAKSKEGLGGYDIYLTTYDADEGTFLEAENVGLPVNSTSDDFLYVTDDTDSLAWFATTRNQPEGKVCVYTFVPSATRQNYDVAEYSAAKMHGLATISRIRDTWPTPELRQQAVNRLEALRKRAVDTDSEERIYFIVDDKTIYHHLDDFRSPADRQAFVSLQKKKHTAEKNASELETMRETYHAANNSERRRMSERIRRAERDLNTLTETIATEEKQIRKNEILLRENQ